MKQLLSYNNRISVLPTSNRCVYVSHVFVCAGGDFSYGKTRLGRLQIRAVPALVAMGTDCLLLAVCVVIDYVIDGVSH